MLEMPQCNAANFQVFLDELSHTHKEQHNIIVLDNGAFHKAKSLVIPKNISLLFLPPYSPELNPAEKIWAKFKRAFTNLLCQTLEHLSQFISEQAILLTDECVKSICGYEYIFEGEIWSKNKT